MVREKTMGYLTESKYFHIPRNTLFCLCQTKKIFQKEAVATIPKRRLCTARKSFSRLYFKHPEYVDTKQSS